MEEQEINEGHDTNMPPVEHPQADQPPAQKAPPTGPVPDSDPDTPDTPDELGLDPPADLAGDAERAPQTRAEPVADSQDTPTAEPPVNISDKVEDGSIAHDPGAANVSYEAEVGDTDRIVESPEDVQLRESTSVEPDWQREPSAHRIGVELKRVETEVRSILDLQDTRRKRKLMGTRRWHELEEDMIGWHYTSKIDQSALKRLGELVAKRHFLYQRLEFLAGTRQGWNS